MVAEYWPSINPINVWDLPYDAWLMFITHYAANQPKEPLQLVPKEAADGE